MFFAPTGRRFHTGLDAGKLPARKITFIAFGTRGDVQPIVALGKALHARGHQVRLIASANFTAWIQQHGLDAVAANVDIQAMMMGEGGHEWIEHGNDPLRQTRVMKRLIDQHGLTMMRDAWRACQDAEVVVSSFTSDVYAVSIAEKLRAKHISTPLQPTLVATRSGMATMNAPLPNRVSLVNYLFGKILIEPYGWRLMGAINNRFRQETLGLPPQSYRENRRGLHRMLVVQGYSAHVVPQPHDWPANIHTAGYWFLDEDRAWQAPQELLEFIHTGEPPVYVGFGSMTGRNPRALTDTIVQAVAQSGQRAILQAGWAGMGDTELPPGIFLLDAAPHSWLFPRMRAVVHHGGAGTTAESLRAGVPMVIVPHLADQPFWGARVAALGVGPQPIPRNRLTAENLAAAIRQATTEPAMRDRATELGATIRAEDGIGAAADVIEAYLGKEDS
ncbi:MAG: glycosyltransferase family 1 protein [Caldilineaceae bacterium]|nr:glycosyltransferase family 1 protein [Caldilineaceae bacterium]